MKAIGTLMLILSCSFLGIAQDCLNKYEEANRAFYNGNLRVIENLIMPCLNTVNKDFQEDILKLLINTSLVLHEDEQSENYMKQLLEINPEYIVRSTDLAPFQKLYRTYQIKTKANFGLIIGTSLPSYSILRYQSYASETQEPSEYEATAGISIGATGDFRLIDNVFLNGSILYTTNGFRQEEILLEYQRVATEQKDYRISIPIQIRYVHEKWKYKPFVGMGGSIDLLLKSKGDLNNAPTPPEFSTPTLGVPFAARNYTLTGIKSPVTYNVFGTAGLQRKVGKFSFEFRVSYEYGLNNQINPDKRFSDPILLSDYAYVADDYKMDRITISLGILRTLSYPDKIK